MIDPCDSILLHELNHAIHLLLLLIYLLIYLLSYHPLRPLLLLPENHGAPVQCPTCPLCCYLDAKPFLVTPMQL